MRIGISILALELDRLGGLSLRLAHLARGLAEAGHDVTIIQTSEALKGSLAFYRSVAGLPLKPMEVNFHFGKGPLFWASLVGLWCLPIGRFLDGVDVLDLWDPLINVPERRPYRVVFSHNHYTPYILQHLRSCGLRSMPMLLEIPFLHRMMREMGRCVDGYIVETERQRKWLVQRWAIPADMIAIVPPGFDAGVIQSAYQSASKQASPGVVFSGRLHRWKGVYELLQVFSSLAQEHPEWNLHFVGDGPARLRLQEQVQERRLQKQVVFWGRKPYDQALSIVASAEVFVLPSYIESFPLSLLEAMALGVPAIATDVGGIRDHLIKNDVTGLLVSSKDLKALRHALTRLISNPELRRNLGVNGQVRVRHQTLDKMVSSTVGCYTRLLSEGSGANPGSVR